LSLATCADLKASIAGLINRTDKTAVIPDWIAMAEAGLNRDLNCRQMFAVNPAFSVSGATVALPAGFAGVRALHLNTSPVTPLRYVEPTGFDDQVDQARVAAGPPKDYTIVGDDFLFSPTPDTTYAATLIYRTRLTPLVADEDTNWLLTLFPDAYLYGAAIHSAPHLRADARLATWATLYERIVSDINADNARGSYGPSPSRRTRSFG
jgi:hypothetical protein